MNSYDGKIRTGMDLYRLAIPYGGILNQNIQCIGVTEFDSNPLDADCYVINRSREFVRAEAIKKEGKKLIIDIDDYWNLPTWHPSNPINLKKQIDIGYNNIDKVNKEELKAVESKYEEEKNAPDFTIRSCRIADAVTVSTEKIQSSLLNEYGIYSTLIKNTIPSYVQQFTKYKTPNKRVRFGWVGGVFHRRDVALIYNGLRFLHEDKTMDGKYQILATFENNPEYKEIEQIMSNGYKCCDDEYKKYLQEFTRIGQHISIDKNYRRLWGKSAVDYGTMYEEIDVALIPLQHGVFNSHKSELKLIEAGSTGCAVIISNVEPYKPFLKDGYNCLTTEGTNGWYRSMKLLINNPDKRMELAYNLEQTIKENFNFEYESSKLFQLISSL